VDFLSIHSVTQQTHSYIGKGSLLFVLLVEWLQDKTLRFSEIAGIGKKIVQITFSLLKAGFCGIECSELLDFLSFHGKLAPQ
jgi:hypothetical protein